MNVFFYLSGSQYVELLIDRLFLGYSQTTWPAVLCCEAFALTWLLSAILTGPGYAAQDLNSL